MNWLRFTLQPRSPPRKLFGGWMVKVFHFVNNFFAAAHFPFQFPAPRHGVRELLA